jgi:hypothetical protein
VVYTCNLSTQEAEAEGSRVLGQPGLHCETPSENKAKQSKGKQNKTKTYNNTAFVNIINNLNRKKMFRNWEAVKLRKAETSFPKS